MKTAIDDAYQYLFQEYRKDWVFFAHHALGHATWSKQRKIIRSVQANQKTAVRAAHGLSKTFSAAEIATIFYNLFPQCRVVTTAPTALQVQKLLWPEIGKNYANANISLIGDCLMTEIKDPENRDHLAYGFSTDKPERSEGAHAWEILVIFDEAKGIPKWWWDSVRGAMSGGFCRWLVISTTDGVEIGSSFYQCFQPGSDWNQIHLSAFDSPYVTGEKFQRLRFPEPGNLGKFKLEKVEPAEIRAQLADKQYIEAGRDPINGWGEGTSLWETKVLGNICDLGADAIIRLSQVRKMNENYLDTAFPGEGRLRAGIDCAWGGSNNTVVWKAKGLKILAEPLIIPSKDLPPLSIVKYQCDLIEQYLENDILSYEVRIDADGGGIGIVSEMQTRGWAVIPIHNGATSNYPDKYANFASEIWFEAAKIIQDIACPEYQKLINELTRRKSAGVTGMDSKGRQAVEKKEEYIKRHGASPDFADSFLYTICNISGGGYAKEVPGDFY
jgi:phage terminase large subunit